jgi:Tol biopolymer transport system component/DNA-binding winged helix-turn-helix (wHTH) protein
MSSSSLLCKDDSFDFHDCPFCDGGVFSPGWTSEVFRKTSEISQNLLEPAMSSQGRHFYEFGPYRVDPEQRILWRGNEPVALQPKAFETLLVLVQHGEGVVAKDELMNRVWEGTFVEESNVAQTIFVLRKALGDSGGEQRYIVTVPGRGYRFVQRVRLVAAEDEAADAGDAENAEDKRPSDLRSGIAKEPVAVRVPGVRPKHRWIGAVVLVLVCLVIIVAVVLRPTVPPAKVLRIRQITHMGTLLHNTKLITDGPRIYFRAWEGHDRVIRYVSKEGGEAIPVDRAFADMDIDDISPDGSEFLVVELGPPPGRLQPLWWVPVPLGSPRSVGTVRTHEARCSPDGRTVVYTVGSDLYLANSEGSNPRKFASLPGEAIYLQWSPDGKRLRFSVTGPQTGETSLWEADLATNSVRPMLPGWPGSRQTLASGWTPDGRYFLFTSLDAGTSNVWTIRERGERFRRVNPEPVQLTAGPLSFYQPTASKDGKNVFAVGEQFRGELVRYDATLRLFVPYARGQSIDEVAFSRDAQWMAYIEFPEGVLVRSRTDGSDRRQLTFAPMRAFNPQWSPDGSQLAFDASAEPGVPRKIYIVPRDGGVPVLAAPDRRDRQVYPSWSSQGNSIVFTSSEETTQNSALYIVDLDSRRVTLLPDSTGLRWGQISPDSRKIVALVDSKLTLYDTASHDTRTLAKSADFPHWSTDGTYVYFRTPYFGPPVENPGTYRWLVSTDKIEKLASDPDFRLNGVYGVWSGLPPDGSLLLVRDLSASDLYVLDVELP